MELEQLTEGSEEAPAEEEQTTEQMMASVLEESRGDEPSPEPGPTDLQGVESESTPSGRSRDKGGRHAKKTPGGTPEQTPEPNSGGQESQPETIPVPAMWRAESKTLWNSLPTEARKALAEEWRNTQAWATQRSDEAAKYSKTLKTRMDALTQRGLSPEQALESIGQSLDEFTRLKDGLGRDKLGAIMEWAASHGITPAHLYFHLVKSGQPQQGGQQQQQAGWSLPKEVVEELQESRKFREEFRKSSATNQENQLRDMIIEFASEMDADGNASRPYFADVFPQLERRYEAALVANPGLSPREALEEAYEVACYRTPEIRQAIETRKLQTEENRQVAAAGRRAQKAQALGVSVSGAPQGQHRPTIPEGDTTEELMTSVLKASRNGAL